MASLNETVPKAKRRESQQSRDDFTRRVTHIAGRILLYALLIGCSLWFIAPLFWMFMSSFMPIDQVGVFPVEWIPRAWQPENYTKALVHWDFATTFRNTLFITLVSLIGHVVSSTVVAYGFARFRFPYRDALFLVLLATMMLPFAVLLIPVYVAYSKIGWVNTFYPLLVPDFFGRAFFIFICRQFFLGIPQELIDAAKIDGASELRIFLQVMIPLARPAIIVICILSFQGTWNDFLGPLIYLQDESLHTLAIGLYKFQALPGQGGIYNQQMAASVMMIMPVLVIFFLFQRQFIQGANISGLKG